MLSNSPAIMTSQLQYSVAENSNHHQLQNQNHNTTILAFLNSPKFRGFKDQNFVRNEYLISPNTILDNRPFSPLTNLSWYHKMNHLKSSPKSISSLRYNFSETNDLPKDLDSGASIGLKLIDTIGNKTNRNTSSSTIVNKMALFKSKLRVEIPQLPKVQPEFTIKFQNSLDHTCELESLDIQTESSEENFTNVSVSEMELSEEYTCVMTHGPNPRTTHIYDNCIVESYYTLFDGEENSSTSTDTEKYFLSFCHSRKRNLDKTDDIYIYRGEKAYCSHDCRYQEILADEAEYPEIENN